MVRKKVGDVALELMQEQKENNIGYETFGLLDEVYSEAKKRGIIRGFKSTSQLKDHPLNRHQVVLNALDRDNRFQKWMMRCTNGRAEVLVRMFKLKEGLIFMTKKKLKKVEVEWIDAQTSMESWDIEELRKEYKPLITKSIGYLVVDKEEYVILGFVDFGNGLIKHFQSIPRCLIKKIKKLDEIDKKCQN